MRKKILYGLGALTLILSSMSVASCEPDYYTNDDPNTNVPIENQNALWIDGESINLDGFAFTGSMNQGFYTFMGIKTANIGEISVAIKLPSMETQIFSPDANIVVSQNVGEKTYHSVNSEGTIQVSNVSYNNVDGVTLIRAKIEFSGKFELSNFNGQEQTVTIEGVFNTFY